MSYTLLDTINLTSSASSITFSSIPSGYTSIKMSINAVNGTSAGARIDVRLNGDTGTNYWFQGNYDNTVNYYQSGQSAMFMGLTASTTYSTYAEITFPDYAGSQKKQALGRSVGVGGGSYYHTWALCGTWNNTAVITSITALLSTAGSFSSGTIASLYGFKAGA